MTLTNYNEKITINNDRPKISHPYKNETTSCKQYVPCNPNDYSENYSTKYFFFVTLIPERLIFIWNGKLMEWKLGAKNVFRISRQTIWRALKLLCGMAVCIYTRIIISFETTYKIWRWAKFQWVNFCKLLSTFFK